MEEEHASRTTFVGSGQERVERSPMAEFIDWCGERFGRSFADYDAFHDWSVSERGAFWTGVWEHCKVIGESGEKALVDGDRMLDARFFPEARLNFAENLLRKTGSGDALIFRGEDKVSYRLTWDELRALVSRLQQALQGAGHRRRRPRRRDDAEHAGDDRTRCSRPLPLGAIWSLLFAGLRRAGRPRPLRPDRPEALHRLRRLLVQRQAAGRGLEGALRWPRRSARPPLIVPYAGDSAALAPTVEGGVTLADFIAGFQAGPLVFERLPFSHPLYIPVLLGHDRRTRNASSIRPAERCCSTSRNIASIAD